MPQTEYMARNFSVLAELMGEVPDEFTPAWLEKAAADAESRCCNGCPILSELYYIRENAERCARWMREQRVDRAKFIGPFRRNPFARGQTVVIRKGSIVRRNGQDVVVRRSYRIRIHSIGEGFSHEDHGPVVVNPSITWPGTGGYWTDLDLGKSPLPKVVT